MEDCNGSGRVNGIFLQLEEKHAMEECSGKEVPMKLTLVYFVLDQCTCSMYKTLCVACQLNSSYVAHIYMCVCSFLEPHNYCALCVVLV